MYKNFLPLRWDCPIIYNVQTLGSQNPQTFPMAFTWSLDLQLEGNDAAKADLIGTLTTKSTTYQYYKALTDWVIAKAGKFFSIPPELGYLVRNSSVENKNILFSLSSNGTTYFKKEFAIQRRKVLTNVFSFIQDPDKAKEIQETYGVTSIFKDGDYTKGLNDDLLRMYLDVSEPGKFADIDMGDILLEYSFTYIDKLTNAGTGVVDAIVSFLNDPTHAAGLGYKLIDQLLGCLEKKMTRSAGARSNLSNSERLNGLLESLLSVKVDGNYEPTRENTVNFQAGLQQAKTLLYKAVAGCTVTSAQIDLLKYAGFKEAILLFANEVYDDTGYNDLQLESEREYDPVSVQYGLIGQLNSILFQFFGKLKVSVQWNSGSTALLSGLDLYTLFLTSYMSTDMMRKLPGLTDDNAQTAGTPINSLDIPLLSYDSNGFKFYNTGSYLYIYQTLLPDPTKPLLYLFNTSTLKVTTLDIKDPGQEQTILSLRPDGKMVFSFRRKYLPFYSLTSAAIESDVVWAPSSGMGDGIGRADTIVDDFYCWTYPAGNTGFARLLAEANKTLTDNKIIKTKINFTITDIASFMGLAKERRVNLAKSLTKRIKSGGYVYQLYVLDPANADDDEEWYVQCNSPYAYATGSLGSALDTADRLTNFMFIYLRKAVELAPGSFKVRKGYDGPQTKTKNRPYFGEVLAEYQFPDDKYWGINMPVAMNVAENKLTLANSKKHRGVIKNKGSYLEKSKRIRVDAGKVMKTIVPYRKNLIAGNTLPATSFANTILIKNKGQDTNPLKDWQQIKQTSYVQFPTDQEWCHLKGHGDGGDERVGNFVSGSFHCNTEQLSIESGQRITTQKNTDTYLLKTTAYLILDDSMKLDDAGGNYLGLDKSYIANAYKTNYTILGNNNKRKVIQDADLEKTGDNAPLGMFIRYKVLEKDFVKDTYLKRFDYIFEGQGEFFDENQYNIIYYTLLYLLNPLEFWKEFYDHYISK